jgi:hypothetical protein
MAIFWILTRGRNRELLPSRSIRAAAAGAILLMILDAISSGLGWRATTNTIRFLTGISAGASLVVLAIGPLLSRIQKSWLRGPLPYRERYGLFYLAGAAGLAFWVLHGGALVRVVNGLTLVGCVLYLALAFSSAAFGFARACDWIGGPTAAPGSRTAPPACASPPSRRRP